MSEDRRTLRARRRNMAKKLSGWHPILDICAAQNVPHHAVRLMAKQAADKGEDWTKKDGPPSFRWLIDTDHARYREEISLIVANTSTSQSVSQDGEPDILEGVPY